MKIVAISDLHGQFPTIKEKEFDVLCICGDIFPLPIQSNMIKCEDWLQKIFIPWCNTLPCEKVLLVAGNHDWFFERTLFMRLNSIFRGTKITYLENELVEIDGYKFYGTPYCHEFGQWAFMRPDERLKDIFEIIPENVDVLLTHDAPHGTSDICLQKEPWISGEHIGSVPLRDAILKKHPKLVLHGHLHSTNHNVELMQDTEVYNVSIVDEFYDMTYNPLVLKI